MHIAQTYLEQIRRLSVILDCHRSFLRVLSFYNRSCEVERCNAMRCALRVYVLPSVCTPQNLTRNKRLDPESPIIASMTLLVDKVSSAATFHPSRQCTRLQFLKFERVHWEGHTLLSRNR